MNSQIAILASSYVLKTLGINGVKYYTNEKHRLNKYYKEWNLYCYNLDKLIVDSFPKASLKTLKSVS
jgi:hypothetical protein